MLEFLLARALELAAEPARDRRRAETVEFTGTLYWLDRQTRSRVVFVVSRVEPIRLLELRIVQA